MALESIRKYYPNGDVYYELRVCGSLIGTVAEVEGGFLVQNGRKPVPSLEAAAQKILNESASFVR